MNKNDFIQNIEHKPPFIFISLTFHFQRMGLIYHCSVEWRYIIAKMLPQMLLLLYKFSSALMASYLRSLRFHCKELEYQNHGCALCGFYYGGNQIEHNIYLCF